MSGGGRTLPEAVGAAGEADSLGIAVTRGLALRAWRDSPTRFREDANLEEDLVLGGYRDRLIVELAQNAADAARRAGAAGRLRLSLLSASGDSGTVLAVANDGAPLDAAGVRALATLRASAKRDEPSDGGPGPVGRFGVGFAAVLEVSDQPAILSRGGGVRFDLAEARDEVTQAARDVPELAVELRRRDGRVPVLRLPYSCEGEPPAGYDTVVVLPLRDSAAERLVRRLLDDLDDALLLTLPALSEVVIDIDGRVRTLASTWRDVNGESTGAEITESGTGTATATRRWRTQRSTVALDPSLLADRPVEERSRLTATITWAVRLNPGELAPGELAPGELGLGELGAGTPGAESVMPLPPTARVVHAPTPTDEPLGLPALLIGDFPLDPTRRHLARGPLLDRLLDAAADAYVRLVAGWPDPLTPALLDLVPAPVGVGEFDAALGRAITGRLPDTPFVPVAADPSVRQRPRDAVALDVAEPGSAAVTAPASLVEALAPVVANLLPAGWDAHPVALRRLGVRRLRLSDMIDAFGSPRHEPGWWQRLYQALAETPSVNGQFAREELGTLPVPLDDGRIVRGPRGVLLPVSGLDTAALRPLGLRLAHPDAAHPLLIRLGARFAEPRAVLADPAVAAAIDAAYDADDPRPVAAAVLALVRAAVPSADERFGLDGLLLPDADGGHTAASELALPGSPLAELVGDALGGIESDWYERWGDDVLRAVGVLDTFDVVRLADVVLDGVDSLVDTHPSLDLDLIEDWLGRVHGVAGGGGPAAAGADERRLGRDDVDRDDTDGDTGYDDLDRDDLDRDDVDRDDVNGASDGDSGYGPDDAGGRYRDGGFDQGMPPVAAELVAVRDLDLVEPDRWNRALALLARPPLRAAVVAPTRLVDGGFVRDVTSYSAWWLGRQPVLDGRRPIELVLPGTSDGDLSGLYDEVPAVAGLDPEFLHALGVRTSVADLIAVPEGPDELLDRLVRRAGELDPRRLGRWYTALAAVSLARVTPPERVCALVRDAEGRPSARVVPAADALVADAPDLLPLLVDRPYLPVAAGRAVALAELLDLDLASEAIGGRVVSDGVSLDVPGIVRTLLPEAPASYIEHDTLLVGVAGDTTELEWRVVDDVVHAATSDGLARGLAWAGGRWQARHGVAALLVEPALAEHYAAESDFDG